MAKTLSLVREIYNLKKCASLAYRISVVCPNFDKDGFLKVIADDINYLQLKQREKLICQALEKFLPNNFKKVVEIILAVQLPALPENFDKEDFYGDFIAVPQSALIAKYGCCQDNFAVAMQSLREMTSRFSCEFSMRNMLNFDGYKSWKYLLAWSKDCNCHIRRLASEASRLKLPWGKKVPFLNDNPDKIIKILDNLYNDPYRYVVRSVANNLNDMAKEFPDLVVKTLERWQVNIRDDKEFLWLEKHSLRTLIKQGYPLALNYLGFSQDIEFDKVSLIIKDTQLSVPTYLEFNCQIIAKQDGNLIIDYLIGFYKANGKNRAKVFKLKILNIKQNKLIELNKKHLLKLMTTKKLYTGEHTLSLQINGCILIEQKFYLEV